MTIESVAIVAVLTALLDAAAGELATEGEFPYHVAILSKPPGADLPTGYCSGTIYDSNTVITTASCCSYIPDSGYETRDFYVEAGTLNQNDDNEFAQKARLSNYIIHRDWEYRETDNNLCLLKLAGPGLDLEASTRVKAIQLSPGSAAPGFVCDVPGWRTSESSTSADKIIMHEYLRYAMVTIQSDSLCRQNNRYPGYNNDRMICGTLGSGTCIIDEGSGLACGNVLSGISAGMQGDCSRWPFVYIDTEKYQTWIRSGGDRYDDPEDYEGDDEDGDGDEDGGDEGEDGGEGEPEDDDDGGDNDSDGATDIKATKIFCLLSIMMTAVAIF